MTTPPGTAAATEARRPGRPAPDGDRAPAPLADLCDRDPLDLEADPRTCAERRPVALPCGPLCTPWCLATHS